MIGNSVVLSWTVYKEWIKWARADNRTANMTDPWIPTETERYRTLRPGVKTESPIASRGLYESKLINRQYTVK